MPKISPERSAYQQAKGRCYNKKNPDYHRYGARGIVMCERWLKSFDYFLSDMGLRPSNKHSLDRVDNNGNYEPSNCRWAIRQQQQNNTRSNIIIEFNGEKKTLKQWCDTLGLSYGLVYLRFKKLKWPIEKAFKEPPDQYYNPLKNKKLPRLVR